MTESDANNSSRLEIVVPCYNEEAVLPVTIEKLRALLQNLVSDGLVDDASSLVFVDDGSSDQTWPIIERAAESFSDVTGVRLATNAGHQNALLAGLEFSSGDMVLSIDADLQDDLGVIPEMVRKAHAGNDVVYGIRSDRSLDSGFKRVTAESYYGLLNLLGIKVIQNHADFRLMKREALERLKQYRESNLYLRGIVPQVGHRTDSVSYKRLAREAGETKYPLRKMIALAVHGITSFSAVPLRFIAGLGLTVFVISFLMGAWVIWVRLFTDSAVPGWASTLLPTFFLGGIQLLSLGVIGEYIANIHIESKRRPRYFVDTITKK